MDSTPKNTAEVSVERCALVLVIIGSVLIPFMGSSLSLILPLIQNELAVNILLLGWIPTAFTLANAALVLPFGRLADIHGRKKNIHCWFCSLHPGISAGQCFHFGAGPDYFQFPAGSRMCPDIRHRGGPFDLHFSPGKKGAEYWGLRSVRCILAYSWDPPGRFSGPEFRLEEYFSHKRAYWPICPGPVINPV